MTTITARIAAVTLRPVIPFRITFILAPREGFASDGTERTTQANTVQAGDSTSIINE
jgi:hypothetical protein